MRKFIVLLLLFLTPIYSYADIIRITSFNSGSCVVSDSPFDVGWQGDESNIRKKLVGLRVQDGNNSGIINRAVTTSFGIYVDHSNWDRRCQVGSYSIIWNCPAGTSLIDGVCVPQCGDGETYNPDTGQCESCEFGANPDGSCRTSCQYFADENATKKLSWDAYIYGVGVTSACYGSGDRCAMSALADEFCAFGDDGFSPGDQCYATFEFTGSSCDGSDFSGGNIPPLKPDECRPGYHAWPKCLGELDPSNPVDKPTDGFQPDKPNVSEPDVPSFDKNDPDKVEPTETTDTAVLTAIQNLNKDSNMASTALNKDLNAGFAKVNNSLNQINAVNTEIGKSIVAQMKQDHEIYLANKQLALNQTGAILSASTDLQNANKENTGAIIDNLDVQTGLLLNGLSGVSLSIDELGDKLEGIGGCDPNTDPLSCEGQHGLSASYVQEAMSQLDISYSENVSASESTLMSAITDAAATPMTGDIERIIDDTIGLAFRAIPPPLDCTPLELPSLSDEPLVIDCEFSRRIKLLLGFVLYVLTLYTLIDILFQGVTPAAGTVPYMSRR